MPIQGCGVPRNRRLFGGVGFLSESDSGSPIGSFLHHTPQLGIPVESVQFLMKLLLK